MVTQNRSTYVLTWCMLQSNGWARTQTAAKSLWARVQPSHTAVTPTVHRTLTECSVVICYSLGSPALILNDPYKGCGQVLRRLYPPACRFVFVSLPCGVPVSSKRYAWQGTTKWPSGNDISHKHHHPGSRGCPLAASLNDYYRRMWL